MRHAFALTLLVLVAGCATPPPKVAPPPVIVPRSPPMRPTGLARVLGQPAKELTALFGDADQDVREEGGARRLQFVGPICILDAYLYPAEGGREGVVSYVDARQPDGKDIDRASCVAALARRKEAR